AGRVRDRCAVGVGCDVVPGCGVRADEEPVAGEFVLGGHAGVADGVEVEGQDGAGEEVGAGLVGELELDECAGGGGGGARGGGGWGGGRGGGGGLWGLLLWGGGVVLAVSVVPAVPTAMVATLFAPLGGMDAAQVALFPKLDVKWRQPVGGAVPAAPME